MRFTKRDLEELTIKGQNSPRKRAPAIMQPDEYPGPQTLINLVLPESYVRPHMHPDNKEIWISLGGKGYLLYFEDSGKLIERITLSGGEVLYEEVPEKQYHGLIALEPMSFVNISQGPHDVNRYKIQADWAPEEGSFEAIGYFNQLRKLVGLR